MKKGKIKSGVWSVTNLRKRTTTPKRELVREALGEMRMWNISSWHSEMPNKNCALLTARL